MKNFKGSLVLLLATLLWGLAFVAQSSAGQVVGFFTFTSSRCVLAGVFLGIILLIRNSFSDKSSPENAPTGYTKKLLTGGLLCGITLFLGMNLQQAGIAAYPPQAAAAGRAGFLTATYVIMIPIAQRFLGKKLRLPVLAAVIGCIAGMYLLCMSNGIDKIYAGDLLELGCAVGFGAYILVVDRCGDLDGLTISCLQFVVCGLLSSIGMLLFEKPDINSISQTLPELIYAGLVSSGIGYTLQIIGQKNADPDVASVIMSMESVFAAVAGWIILGQALLPRELLGCALVFISVITAQIPEFTKKRK